MSTQARAISILAVLVLILGALLLRGQGGVEPQQTGRFQIFQGEYVMTAKSGQGIHEKGVFRMDTATGKVTKFFALVRDNGQYIETWMPVAERPSN